MGRSDFTADRKAQPRAVRAVDASPRSRRRGARRRKRHARHANEDVRLGERFRVQGGVLTALRTPTLLESESAIAGDRSVLI